MVEKFEIRQDFMDCQDYMGLSLTARLRKWLLLDLSSYNLNISVTAGIEARFSMLLFICIFKKVSLFYKTNYQLIVT